MEFLARLFKEEKGQGVIEYVLILGLIVILAVSSVALTGTSIKGLWEDVSQSISQGIQLDGI